MFPYHLRAWPTSKPAQSKAKLTTRFSGQPLAGGSGKPTRWYAAQAARFRNPFVARETSRFAKRPSSQTIAKGIRDMTECHVLSERRGV